MSEILRLNNFALSGLNTDILPWDLPGDFLTYIKNVRIKNKRIGPFGGHYTWANLPVDFDPAYIQHIGSTSGIYWVICGDGAVWAYDGSTFSDISSGAYAGITDKDLWSGCQLSAIPIFNNPGHFPEYWSPQSGAQALQPLMWDASNTWQAANQACDLIRSHKQYLFALGIYNGVDHILDGVRWSSPADINGLPATWDPLDTTNVAGLTQLGADGGVIIDGRSLRDAFTVYRESSISVFDFVGGPFVWRVRHLNSTVGLVSSEALQEVKGVHLLIGDGDVLMNDGNQITSLLHDKIRNQFANSINPDTYQNSYSVKNNVASEVWFCIPTDGATYPNLAYIYNWRDNSWSIRDIPEAPHANYGPQKETPLTWDELVEQWNTYSTPWGSTGLTPLDDTIVQCTSLPGAGQQGKLLILDKAQLGYDEPFDTVIERIGFALDGLNKVTTITTVYPHAEGPEPFYVQIGSHDYAGSPVRWKPAVLFDPTQDRKVDIRTTGELHAFRFYGEDITSSWAISGIDVEYSEAGLR